MSEMSKDLQLPVEAGESKSLADLPEVRQQEAEQADEPLRHDEGVGRTRRETGGG